MNRLAELVQQPRAGAAHDVAASLRRCARPVVFADRVVTAPAARVSGSWLQVLDGHLQFWLHVFEDSRVARLAQWWRGLGGPVSERGGDDGGHGRVLRFCPRGEVCGERGVES